PWREVPPASHGIPRAPWYSGTRPAPQPLVDYGAVTRSGPTFQPVRLNAGGHRADLRPCPTWPYNPAPATAAALARTRFGLLRVRSPLLAESRLISVPRGTKMFQFPRFPSEPDHSDPDAGASPPAGCPIRVSAALRPLTAPHGFSQPATPFLGS